MAPNVGVWVRTCTCMCLRVCVCFYERACLGVRMRIWWVCCECICVYVCGWCARIAVRAYVNFVSTVLFLIGCLKNNALS